MVASFFARTLGTIYFTPGLRYRNVSEEKILCILKPESAELIGVLQSRRHPYICGYFSLWKCLAISNYGHLKASEQHPVFFLSHLSSGPIGIQDISQTNSKY